MTHYYSSSSSSQAISSWIWFMVLLPLGWYPSFGQARSQVAGLQCIDSHQQEILLSDLYMIVPHTITISPKVPFVYDARHRKITVDTSAYTAIALQVCYRTIAIPVTKKYSLLSSEVYDSSMAFRPRASVSIPIQRQEALFATPSIRKSGSLTRGINFGNTQSVGVHSTFNFQMQGKLSDKLNIRADITDQQIPFQPEGNTLRLQAFDHIGVEVYNDQLSLKAGDLVLHHPPSYFLRFNKNVVGAAATMQYEFTEHVSGSSTIAVAVAKGQFADLTIPAIAGMQGPYQLQGIDGQQYFVVLANSESVYLDGQLLTRGVHHDYIINYNLGELTFNPTQVITQFSRIRITFEYSDQNYRRTIVAVAQQVKLKKTTIQMGFYQEKDNQHKPLAFTLTAADQLRMYQAGDEHLPVPITGAVAASFHPSLVLYQRDTRMDDLSNSHQVYVYSKDTTAALFQVTFTDVGQGQGHYNLLSSDVNGRVYQWVAPKNNQPQGRYLPIRLVPAPSAKAMFSAGVITRWSDYLHTQVETAISSHDQNLYSPLGNDRNHGLATNMQISLTDKPIAVFPGYKFSTHIAVEHNSKYFKPIDRFRLVEYDRNWGYASTLDTIARANNMLHASIKMYSDTYNFISYQTGYRNKEGAINGYQHTFAIKKRWASWLASANFHEMHNTNSTAHTQWRKWSAELAMDRFAIVPGYRLIEDRNEVRKPDDNTLIQSAMNFRSHQIYLRSNDSAKYSYRLAYLLREDRTVQQEQMQPYLQSKTWSVALSSPRSQNQMIDLVFNLRGVQYATAVKTAQDEQIILGKLKWNGNFLDGSIQSNLTYTTASSRELLKAFVYLEVATGQGTHTWQDLNGDGIQDITEFFIAINFDEKQFIKVFVPTTTFVNAYQTVFTYSLQARFPVSWQSQSRLAGGLSKFSVRTNININKKNTNDGLNNRFNPFELNLSNEELIYARYSWRGILLYSDTNKRWLGEISYFVSHVKQLIANGIDARKTNEWSATMRMPMFQDWTFDTVLLRKKRVNASQFQENRNFHIIANEMKPSINWQPLPHLRIGLSYRYAQKNNVIEAGNTANAILTVWQSTFRWSASSAYALDASFSTTNISYQGEENTAVSYELLEALQPGVNYGWRLNYSQKLLSGLQLTLSYEGRKSSKAHPVHIGRMQVTALF